MTREASATGRAIVVSILLLLAMPMQSADRNKDAGRPDAPDAEKRSHPIVQHGQKRDDSYYWLRDDTRSDPDVLGYLEAENAYANAHFSAYSALTESIFEEIVGRIEKDESSVPFYLDGYWYSTRYAEGREYPIFERRPESISAPPQLLLDANPIAEEYDYYAVGAVQVSPDDRWLAYTEDILSRRQYQLRFKNLASGELSPTVITNIQPGVAWSNDSKHIYYLKKHPETLLGYQVYRHKLGSDPAKDLLVYEEQDDTWYSGLSRSKSGDYILLSQAGSGKSAVAVLDANDPDSRPVFLAPRADGFEYSAEHLEGAFTILHNRTGPNYELARRSDDKLGDPDDWTTLVAHDPAQYIEEFEVLPGHVALNVREQGQGQLRVLNLESGKQVPIDFQDEVYEVGFTGNYSGELDYLRFSYSSMTTPELIFDYELATGSRHLRKAQQIPSGWEGDRYEVRRVYATARDGVKVPMTLFYRKDLFKGDGSNPVMVYGYSSYGATLPVGFSRVAPSLADRGFVWVDVHARGSSFLGRQWYEQGKMFKKKNTFNDFVDATRHLVESGVADGDKVFAWGGSAGGLLMGAVANQAPDLYRGIVAEVPFVDVVTTMSDPSIPLTTGEYTEWGNPADRDSYDYMMSYSPYDNVRDTSYPNMLVMTGLWDSQVQYFEPAKWVARLRDHHQGNNKILFSTDMTSGHGGASGRYSRYRDHAMAMSFAAYLAENDL